MEIKPFIQWTGGKGAILDSVLAAMDFKDKKIYVEPFVGGGSVFLGVLKQKHFKKYFISDANAELINVYQTIQNDVEGLIIELENICNECVDYFTDPERIPERDFYYYERRIEYNELNQLNSRKAALFIFLNKTCFNALYRVNKKGKFNVPIGTNKNFSVYDAELLRELHKEFNEVDITFYAGDYKRFIGGFGLGLVSNGFFYFDTPYKGLTKAGFTAYQKSGFNDDEQIKLANLINELCGFGANFLLSNSDTRQSAIEEDRDFFDNLYSDYDIARVWKTRGAGGKGSERKKVTEILVKRRNNE